MIKIPYIWKVDISSIYVTAIIPLIPFFSAIASGILDCFLASGLPETGRKAIKKNCPLLFFHFGHRLVYNNLLRVQSCIVHLVEYRMPLILYFACHLLFSDYPFPYPARTTGEFLPAPLCIARHTGDGYVNMVIIRTF